MINCHNTTASAINYVSQNERPLTDAMSSSDLVAVTSAIIALLALFATIYSSLLQRTHNRLSSKPALNMVLDAAKKSVYLSNHGLGPAFLKEVEAVFDGRTYNLLEEKDSDEFSEHVCASLQCQYGWMVLEKDSALAEGAEHLMLVVYSKEQREWDALHDALDRCSIKVKYESVYKEKAFTAHLGNNFKPKKSSATGA